MKLKSPVEVGNITSGIVSYDDGSWQDCTMSVQAIENVTVPLGSFDAFKAYESCTFPNGGSYSGSQWWVPQIHMVKEISVNNEQLDVVIEATDTNF